MGIVQLFGAPAHLAPATIGEHAIAREVEREPEQPVSFAEIVAASSFLDFGGLPAGRWIHALPNSRPKICRS
jgi:hypothetical protein